MLEVFLKGLIIGIGASIPLGPIGVLCIQKTLSKGRLSGFLTGLGASISDTFYSAISLLGLFLVDSFVNENKAWVMFVGGIVICLIGVKVYFSNPVKQIKQKKKPSKGITDMFEALAMTITNPGSIFLIFAMFAAVRLDLSAYSDEESRHAVRLVLVGICAGTALWWYLLSTLINAFRKKFRIKQLIVINKISGIIIFALGVVSFGEGLFLIFKQYFL